VLSPETEFSHEEVIYMYYDVETEKGLIRWKYASERYAKEIAEIKARTTMLFW
jgi:hypothetical protein